jgi:hypothetical protein
MYSTREYLCCIGLSQFGGEYSFFLQDFSAMSALFQQNYWGNLSQFELPHCVIQDEALILTPSALSILLILFEEGHAKHTTSAGSPLEVLVDLKEMMDLSGYSKDVVTKATNELEDKKFIQPNRTREKDGQFGSKSYVLCNPTYGLPLKTPPGKNFLYANKVQYIKIPADVIKRKDQRWSLAKMSGSEIKMYVSLCWLANRDDECEFDVKPSKLRRMAGLSTAKIAEPALEELFDKGLVYIDGDHYTLNDPYTCERPSRNVEDPSADSTNYFVKPAKGRATRMVLNTGRPEDVEKILVACGADPRLQHNGEFMIACPFHADSSPSCSVSPTKRTFHCFGCLEGGTFLRLVMKLKDIDKGAAYRFMAEVNGQVVEFREPDSTAEAIYSYRDSKGKLIKQVLRRPGKDFVQRRPVKGGKDWDYFNVCRLQPTLYNLQWFSSADVVCLCEGEKDADTITKLRLYSPSGGGVFGSTSGGSSSWQDSLADDLKGKKVVVMPDFDEAGKRYCAEIIKSLEARDIEYVVVSFGDTGAKDVTDFIKQGGTREELVGRIGRDWVCTKVLSLVEKMMAEEPDVPVEI